MLSTVEKVLILRSVELFSQLPGEALVQIAGIATEEAREAGDDLYTEGDAADALYVVLSGRVRLHGESRERAELGPRTCFGQLAILDTSARMATASALESLSMLRVSRGDFQEAMAEEPAIAAGIIGVLARRLRDTLL